MRQFRIHEVGDNDINQSETNISVLVRVSDTHSDSQISFDFLVDPWRFFELNELALKPNWYLQGTMPESDGPGSRKRLKRTTLHATWGTSSTTRSSRHDKGKRVYTYRTLPPESIRLLRLLPGEKKQHLRGIINHVSANPRENYCTLSYVWGMDDTTDELITPDGSLNITPSLGRALRHLRQKTIVLVLWVDAVCINQKDNTEKAHQIQLLPKIFQHALFTYAFWDTSHRQFDAAVEMLMQVRVKAKLEEERLNKTLEGHKAERDDLESAPDGASKHGEDWPKELARIPESWKNHCIPHADDPIWGVVKTLFSRPWFRRAWIVQETVASSMVRVVCGRWLVDFSDIHFAIEIIDREAQVSDDNRLHRLRATWQPFLTLATQREWEMMQHRWTLLFLLEHFRHAESTLSRDRFFALLGLASDANEPEFAPDYDSPLETIILKVATVFVRQGRGMQMLYNAGLNTHSHRFPSWIPDWTKTRPDCLHESDQRATPFAASGPHGPQISKSSADSDELLVGGYVVDRVQHVSVSTNTEIQWKQYLAEVDAMIDQIALAAVPDSREDLKWKIPIAGVEYPKFSTEGTLDLKPSYMALRDYLDGHQIRAVEDAPINESHTSAYTAQLQHLVAIASRQESESYASALRDVAVGWRFITTERGYVGVAPGLTEIGDTVAVLKGGLVPFILRESSERPGASRLVGESYVHGIMYREGLLFEGLEERDFRIQ